MTREQLIEMCAAARASLPSILAADARNTILRAMSSALIENKDLVSLSPWVRGLVGAETHLRRRGRGTLLHPRLGGERPLRISGA